MDISQKIAYAKAFLDLNTIGNITIKSNQSSAYLRTEINLKKELKKYDDSFEEKEFLNVAFAIVKTIRGLVLKDDQRLDEDLIEIAEELLLNIPGLREEMIVKASSNLDLLDEINYEILTKRNKNEICKIDFYSVLLNINTTKIKERSSSLNVELTRNEINEIIVMLQRALEEINNIEEQR